MKECDTLVSIIVPVYGTQAYLPACIESLCKQTYKNLQIILVDDESPDQCPEICDDYAKRDARITVIHQTNKGVSGARNTGLSHANGGYIVFVDSDDALLPDAVSVLLTDALDYGADIVWAPQKNLDKNGRVIGTYEEGAYAVFQEVGSLLHFLNGKEDMSAVWGKIFKADFIKDIRFEEGKNINEDDFFMFQCYMKQPLLVRHNHPVYCYNIRPGSCSRQKFSDKYLTMLYFCDKKKELIATHYPQYADKTCNMEMLTNLQLLDLLCSTTDKSYKKIQKQCIQTVRTLRRGHQPYNRHYAQLAFIAAHGLYPLYKIAFRLKYCR